MIYYVKEGQNSIFQKILVKENQCEISKVPTNVKKLEKLVEKIKKRKIEPIVLSKELKKNKKLIEYLKNYDVGICKGEWLAQYMIEDIINYLSERKKITLADEITILINDLTDEAKAIIKVFADKYKRIRILTNHSERFKKIEEELYEKQGISIIFTNNKRKALSKSNLIINLDFVEEIINQYNINENAVIISFNNQIKIKKKRFSGIVITDYEVEFGKMDEEEALKLEDILHKQSEFSLKEIIEEKIYTQFQKLPNYNRFETTKELIEKYNLKIKELHGINGIIK